MDGLQAKLHRLEGKGYPGYRKIRGSWAFPGFRMEVLYVQGDPFAAPSRLRVSLPPSAAALPAAVLQNPARRVGVAALLARAFGEAARTLPPTGSGGSGAVRMEVPGQEVLPQTAVQIGEDGSVEARFTVGLPARGRRILGSRAAELLCHRIPELVERTLPGRAHPEAALLLHARVNEDADALRQALAGLGLVAFVADGACLPRASGVDDRPLQEGRAVPFESPDSLRVTVTLPHAGPVSGMGIPRGITVITGGGFHGKSTLLRAVEQGVYNHRPGDGRERVVTVGDAMKIRAEDGRAVAGVDISPFIAPLPDGTDTRRFSTSNASGSTSQAAAVMEALEAGATTLLMDEDSCATNFLLRDARMQALIPGEDEPITPFLDRAGELRDHFGVSTLLVLGGSGAFLDIADTVVALTAFVPSDVTARARGVSRTHPTHREARPLEPFPGPRPRSPDPRSIDPARGRREVSVKVSHRWTLHFGESELDLRALEQVVSRAQLRGMGEGLILLRRELETLPPDNSTLAEGLDRVEARMDAEGLDALGRGSDGDLAWFRRLELAGALNRLRGLRVEPG